MKFDFLLLQVDSWWPRYQLRKEGTYSKAEEWLPHNLEGNMIEKEKKDGSENPSGDVVQQVPTLFYQ